MTLENDSCPFGYKSIWIFNNLYWLSIIAGLSITAILFKLYFNTANKSIATFDFIGIVLITFGFLLGGLIGFILISSCHTLEFHDEKPWFVHSEIISFLCIVIGLILLEI